MFSAPPGSRFVRIALVAMIAAGCASQPASEKTVSGKTSRKAEPAPAAAPQAKESRYASQTLADLENVEIEVTEGSIDEASIEGALVNYKQAVQLFNDPEKRVESLRRMADLAMAASTEKEGEGVSLEEAPVVPAQLSEAEEVKLDREIDAMLFKSFMQGAQDAKTQEERYRMLDLAGGIVPELEGSDLAANYETAILLYQTVIKNSQDPAEKAEAFYLLAKAYDIAGKHEESVATLKELGRQYPNSTFYLEAQFRLGESYFSEGEYDLSIGAYSEVIRAGSATTFYEQSIYKRGWGYYKVSEYEKALVDFFALIDLLDKVQAEGKEADRNQRLLDDTFRVASMSFNNLDGAKSVTAWFRKNGRRGYEHKIYRALGEVYVKQERFVDAADTFETFVLLYPDSDLAPEFSSSAIKALQDGGFPTQVLPAKERFVKAYGINSKYWGSHEKQRTEYLPLLKSHLLDLAKHHHATAQKGNDTAEFLVAAGWYKQLLETDPKDPGAATINHLYAEALFSGREFVKSVREFERTAYEYPGYDKAAEAAYFGLVAYQAYGDEMKGDPKRDNEYKQLLTRKIDAGLKFARTFQGHEKAPGVLQNIVEDQLAKKDVAGAISTAGLLVSLNPPPPPALQKYGWQTIANGEFDLGRHKVAEFAFTKVLAFNDLTPADRKTYNERLAASIYKQGEKLIAEGKELEGAKEYMRVGTVVPDAGIRANAEFDAATIYLKKEQWNAAIPVLEQFRVRYPKNTLGDTIPDKLAVAYEKTGNFAGAAREMETIHDTNLKTDPELARNALWQAAEFTEKTGNEDGVIRLYNKYIAENPQPLEARMEAQYRLLKIAEKRGDLRSRDTLLAALASGAKNAGPAATPRTNYLGAFASFTVAEPVFQRFTEYKLKAPLKTSLAEKRRLMQAALDSYATTAKLGVAEFASAAQFRTAEVYRILAADLMSSERPRGLDELELEQYDLLLEEQALPFEDQAITLYTQNTDLVKQDIYDDWVKKSFKALSVLQPGRFAKKEQTEEYVDVIY
ncbi:MAG: tetratricopeptide repeat protein [Pseudomonadota bacterium]